jgi:hypothetical protein
MFAAPHHKLNPYDIQHLFLHTTAIRPYKGMQYTTFPANLHWHSKLAQHRVQPQSTLEYTGEQPHLAAVSSGSGFRLWSALHVLDLPPPLRDVTIPPT